MKKILILASHFMGLNLRRELIEKLIKEGYEVYISIPNSDRNKFFANLGCKIIETPIDRRGINPLKDISLILNYANMMKK